MAGHSKWSNTKHRKSSQDIKRSKIFTKLIREITTASIKKGQDPKKNFYLRTALDKASTYNMTKNTIQRAIKRSKIKQHKNNNLTIYSGYGPGGAAFIMECYSENNNHTVSKLREIFSRCEGHLVKNKNVEYLFQKNILLRFNDMQKEKTILDIALKNSAYNIKIKKNLYIEMKMPIKKFKKIKKELCKLTVIINAKKILYIPKIILFLEQSKKKKIKKLLKKLNEFSEIKNIYYNFKL
ncbi:YebC/PmpR family DNA-binding transcriptional regulator [Buchnera aphidicola]|uniref:YebC/PmpR family DNA-binding transcriptional regulator n=1 Tax=Buchnera aphidicola TaxID=9 RepID=UPI00094D7066|nr:YebC/PmpR family DNA-binding transcriptional regulator [Buchnera aphidicola]